MSGFIKVSGSEGESMESNELELSRSDVLLKGALAVGALYGLGAVSPYVRAALADEAKSDVEILNYLLPFEYLQASLYSRGKSEINDKGEKLTLKPDQKELMELLAKQEGEHVAAVKEMIEELGGKPVEKETYAFAFREYPTLLSLASYLEPIAAGAYNGAIYRLKSEKAQELTASIAQIEGRHAAAVLIPQKEEPAPEAF